MATTNVCKLFFSTLHVLQILKFFNLFHLQNKQLEFGELEWLTEMGIFGDQVPQEAMAAAEVPQLPISQPSYGASYRATKSSMPYKRPRIEILDDEDEHFTVPDLGWT